MLIALLTDFGLTDAYVGVMKAVILSRTPGATLLDLTHGVPPQDVRAGALHLLSAAPYCPPDTLFLAVVDPGVGGARRAVCLRSGTRLFVGPDNGLLWPAAAHFGPDVEAWSLDRPERWLPSPGSTFHGRDIFAPVAAALASGAAPDEVGTLISDPVRLLMPKPAAADDGVRGEVLLIDGYGNAVTNIRPDHLPDPAAGSTAFSVAGVEIAGPSTHYGAVAAGETLVALGSLGFYEIAVNCGSAARRHSIAVGAEVLAVRIG